MLQANASAASTSTRTGRLSAIVVVPLPTDARSLLDHVLQNPESPKPDRRTGEAPRCRAHRRRLGQISWVPPWSTIPTEPVWKRRSTERNSRYDPGSEWGTSYRKRSIVSSSSANNGSTSFLSPRRKSHRLRRAKGTAQPDDRPAGRLHEGFFRAATGRRSS